MTLTAPSAMLPNVQVSGNAAFPGVPGTHWPALGVADTMVTSAGRLSRTTTSVAIDGPRFVTVMVCVMFWPATTVAGRPVFVSARSAFEKNDTPSLAQLLSKSRSGVVLSTHAV